MRVVLAVLLALIAAGIAAVWFWPKSEADRPVLPITQPLPAPCRDMGFEGDVFVVCTVDPTQYAITIRCLADDGKPIERLDRIKDTPDMIFAMNGGMYHEDMSPVGLYVEDGVVQTPLNEEDGTGNFFMKPNGVFFIDPDGRVHVMETRAFAAQQPQVLFATQSGPMLVIDGQIHPRFEPDGASRNVRNGVGVDRAGHAVFVISRGPVSFGKLGRLMRDDLGCDDALYLDGTISALHDGTRYVVGGKYPVGPVIIVSGRPRVVPTQ
ncbi:MAG: phosphodiester glycosidase family protein [Mesorhizobium sp.]